MEIRLLGPLEVLDDAGEHHGLGGPKPRALLAMLALGAGRTLSVDALVDALWPEDPPKTAVKNLQTYVVQLRRSLGSALVTRHGGYSMELEPEKVDAHLFEALTQEAEPEARRPAVSLAAVEQALALWRGDPMADLRFSPPLAAEAIRLHELRLRALELRAGALLDLGRHDEVLAEVSGLVEQHPLRERLWVHLMMALYRSGRHPEALRAFQRAREALAEVGLDPSPGLVALEDAVVRHDPALPPAKPARPRTVPVAAILAAGRSEKFVGREAESRAVEEAWDAVAAGDRRVVLVSGEPGIGKTRLAAEVAASVAARGGLVLSGRCDQGGLLPFQPFIEALCQYAPVAPDDAVERALGLGGPAIVRLVPELAQRTTRGDAQQSDLQPDRHTLFQSIVAILGDASARGPLMLVLDDLHWADDATLLLLRHLMRSPDARVAALVTFRDTEAGDVLAEHLALLAREVDTVRVPLDGLSEQEVLDLVRARHPDSGEDFSRLVHQVTEGNPFFVEEVLHDLATSEGVSDPSGVGVPVGVREVIERRLARLPAENNRLLQAASVVGTEFDVALLGAVVGAGEDDVVAALDHAASTRLVCEVAGTSDCYRFSHALVRAALLERLSASRRTRLHRSVADVLERIEAEEPGTHIAQLAHHLGEAGATVEAERVFHASVRAADHAIEHFGYEDAVRHYERALVAFERRQAGPAEQRCEILLGKGRAHVLAGQFTAAKSTFLEAADLARTMGSPSHLGRAAIGLSSGRPLGAEAAGSAEELLVEEALAALSPENVGLRVLLLARLSQWLHLVRDDQYLLELTAEALTCARGEGDEALVIEALVARAFALHMPDHAEERIACTDELQRLGEQHRHRDAMLAARRHRLWALLQLGDPRVWVEMEEHASHARRVRTVLPLLYASGFNALRCTMEGRFADAEAAAQEMNAWNHEVEHPGAFSLTALANIRRLEGRLAELGPSFRPLASRAGFVAPSFCSGLALMLAETRQFEEAARLLEGVAGKRLEGVPRNRAWSPVVSNLALTAAIVKHVDMAGQLYVHLLPYRGRNLVMAWNFFGAVDDHLGLLAEVLGRADEAARHLTDALAQYERLGARPWVVLAQVALARVLLATGTHCDRARSLLADALRAAEMFGMQPAAAESRRLLGRYTFDAPSS